MPRIPIDLIITDDDYEKITMETPIVRRLWVDILGHKGVYSPIEITRDTKRIVDGRARLFVVKNLFKEKYIEVTYVPELSDEEIKHYTASKYFVVKDLHWAEEAKAWVEYLKWVQLKEPEIYSALKPGRPSINRDKLAELGILTKSDVAEARGISIRTLSRHTNIYKNLTPKLQDFAIEEALSPTAAEELSKLALPFKEEIDKKLTSNKDNHELREKLKEGDIKGVTRALGYGIKEIVKPIRPIIQVPEILHAVVRTEHMDKEVKDFLRQKPEFAEKEALAIKPIVIINQKDIHYIVLQSIPTNEDLTDGLEDGLYQFHKFLMNNAQYKGVHIQENKIVGEAKHVCINRDRVNERELISIYLGTSKKGGYFD
jgi:hypothetical protein